MYTAVSRPSPLPRSTTATTAPTILFLVAAVNSWRFAADRPDGLYYPHGARDRTPRARATYYGMWTIEEVLAEKFVLPVMCTWVPETVENAPGIYFVCMVPYRFTIPVCLANRIS
jgi:hypothetical protein